MPQRSFFTGLNDSKKVISTIPTKGGPPPINSELHTQIEQLKEAFQETQNKTKLQMNNLKKVTAFNEQLSKSYLGNLQVIIQISSLLTEIYSFIQVIRQSVDMLDQDVSASMNFDYIQSLTRSNISSLHENFKKEIKTLKTIYTNVNMPTNIKQLEDAEQMMEKTVSNANTIFEEVKVKTGGKQKKERCMRRSSKIFNRV